MKLSVRQISFNNGSLNALPLSFCGFQRPNFRVLSTNQQAPNWHYRQQTKASDFNYRWLRLAAIGGIALGATSAFEHIRQRRGIVHCKSVEVYEDKGVKEPSFVGISYGPSAEGAYNLPQPSNEVRADYLSLFNRVVRERGPSVYEQLQRPTRELLAPLPKHVPYLIIGAGTAALHAARTIRACDPNAKVLLIGEETHVPYMRPPLSKQLWQRPPSRIADVLSPFGDSKKHSWMYFEPESFYLRTEEFEAAENGGIAFAPERTVTSIDVEQQKVRLVNGEEVSYDKCLIATGGKPRVPPVFANAKLHVRSRIATFRNIDDFKKVYVKLERYMKRVAVIGGGFLGTELAYGIAGMHEAHNKQPAEEERRKKEALKQRAEYEARMRELGHDLSARPLPFLDEGQTALRASPYQTIEPRRVVQIFPEAGPLGLVLPPALSDEIRRTLEQKGVTVVPCTTVTGLAYQYKKDAIALQLSNGEAIDVDYVLVCTGIQPNTALGASSGIPVADGPPGGFVADSELNVAPNIWVAGDVAAFPNPVTGEIVRMEHHVNAERTGQVAGENMTGGHKNFDFLSNFWCDVGSRLSFESVGTIDARMRSVVFVRQAQSAADKSAKPKKSLFGSPDPKANAMDELPSHGEEALSALEQPGVVFYLDARNHVRGVLLWNLHNEMFDDEEFIAPQRLNIARKLILDGKEFANEADLAEAARLFDLYETVGDDFRASRASTSGAAEKRKKDEPELTVTAPTPAPAAASSSATPK